MKRKRKQDQTQSHDYTMDTKSEQQQMIDELTDRLIDTEIKLNASGLQNKHITAKNTVKTHVIAGMSMGMVPAPIFDIAALTGIQVNMLRKLCQHYQIDFDEKKSKALLVSLVNSSLPVLSVIGLSSFAKVIPGIGTLGGGFCMAVAAGAVIYASGKVFIRHFDVGGTLDDFDTKYWAAYFKQEFEEGKDFVKESLKNLGKESTGENS